VIVENPARIVWKGLLKGRTDEIPNAVLEELQSQPSDANIPEPPQTSYLLWIK
jgi:hypothetical protein